jgi:N-acetylmuramoyl-L-alanine amidase
MPFEMPDRINGVPVRRSFIPLANSNRPGLPVTAEGAQWITVHETGNPNRGANAEMHRRFVHNGGGASAGNDGVSFTFVVDDTEIIWLVPLEERTWQASDGADGPGNSSTSIETCINADGDFAKACENVAQLVAWLALNHPQKSAERVAQHNKWARDGKNCPARMRANNGAGWNALMARVRALATPKLVIPGTPGGYGFVAGFRAYVEALGRCRYPQDVNAGIASIVGLPLEDEWRGADGLTYQRTERAVLQWNPNNAPPFDVVILPRHARLPDKAA